MSTFDSNNGAFSLHPVSALGGDIHINVYEHGSHVTKQNLCKVQGACIDEGCEQYGSKEPGVPQEEGCLIL
jgi:hypothetical protein